MGHTYSHAHYEKVSPPHNDLHSLPTCTNIASLTIPATSSSLQFTILKLDTRNQEGRKVCQQVTLDLGRF